MASRPLIALETVLGIKSKGARAAALVALGILLVHWALMLLFVVPRIGNLSTLRLHYTAALGIDWLGQWWKIFIYPSAGLAVFFVNGFLSAVLVRSQPRFGTVMHGATAALQFVLVVSGVIVLLLNA